MSSLNQTLQSHPRVDKTNVLIVASSLWIGGAEVVIRHLAETLDRTRFNVTVCYLKERGTIGDDLARAGVDIVPVSDRTHSWRDYLTFVKLAALIRARGIQIVHTHTVDGLSEAGLCRLLMPRVKLVHTFHFGNYPHARSRLLWLERIFARIATQLLSVGDVQQRQIRKVYGLRGDAIRTIWNGVRLRPDQTNDSMAFRRRLNARDRVVIGTVATFIEQKGLRDLLTVAGRVRDAGAEVVFAIVGEGPLRAQLEERRRELQLEDTVVFTGWVPNAAEAALPAFDVFFQPSLWEAMSVVLLEAMAAGSPIVATRVGENPHIIADGENGLLVDAKDVDGMASALLRLIRDPDLRKRLGNAARHDVERRFTVDHMTRAYEGVYQDVLG